MLRELTSREIEGFLREQIIGRLACAADVFKGFMVLFFDFLTCVTQKLIANSIWECAMSLKSKYLKRT